MTPTNTLRDPIVLAYGVGVDSTAIIVGFVARGIRPDAILFADVGGEKDETYAYLPVINAYLEAHGFPTVTVVRYQAQNFKHYPHYFTLEQNCLTNGTLPSEAFGSGSCSQKWKAAPQHKWLQAWQPAIDAWARGGKVRRAIGFEASCNEQARTYRAEKTIKPADAKRFDYWYPLQDWGWDREECKRQIAAAGLPVPLKSSCWFCPNMKPAEIRELPADKLRRIVLMEARWEPRRIEGKVEGLWRKAVKGKYDITKKKPGSISQFIREEGLLPAHEVDSIARNAPRELIDRAQAFENGLSIKSWDEVLSNLDLHSEPAPIESIDHARYTTLLDPELELFCTAL